MSEVEDAKRALAAIEPAPGVTFRGITLEHFTAEELVKIAGEAMRMREREREFYQHAIEGYRALAGVVRGPVHNFAGCCPLAKEKYIDKRGRHDWKRWRDLVHKHGLMEFPKTAVAFLVGGNASGTTKEALLEAPEVTICTCACHQDGQVCLC